MPTIKKTPEKIHSKDTMLDTLRNIREQMSKKGFDSKSINSEAKEILANQGIHLKIL